MNRCDVALGLIVIKNGPKRPTTMKKPTIALPTATLRLIVIARQMTSSTCSGDPCGGPAESGRSATGAALAAPDTSWVCMTTHSFLFYAHTRIEEGIKHIGQEVSSQHS